MNEEEWIARFIEPRSNPDNPLCGPGDDAALLQGPAGTAAVITVDSLVSGQHFRPEWLHAWHPPEILARRLLRGSLSDISAMGGIASGVLLSLESEELPGFFSERFWQGIDEELATHSLILLGGNLTRCSGGLSLHATVVGHVDPDRSWRRDSAQPGDRIGVTGHPGKAAQALDHLQRGSAVADQDPWRFPASRQRFVTKLNPMLQRNACAIDLSDGLGLDLLRVCKSSQVCAEIDLNRLVSVEGAPTLKQVVSGGEDYELLLVIDPGEAERVEQVAKETGTPFRWIGSVKPMSDQPQIHWHDAGRALADLPEEKGWDPFRQV